MGTPEERASGAKKTEVEEVAKKYFSVLEEILPSEGFVNGLDYPTPGDLAVVNICEGYMPFGSAYKHASLNLSEAYPKLSAPCERVKANADVAAALEGNATLKAPFPGM